MPEWARQWEKKNDPKHPTGHVGLNNRLDFTHMCLMHCLEASGKGARAASGQGPFLASSASDPDEVPRAGDESQKG